jgi:hypothetical protein
MFGDWTFGQTVLPGHVIGCSLQCSPCSQHYKTGSLVCELHLICIEFAHFGACFESGRVNLQAQTHTGPRGTSAVTCAGS